MACVLAYLVSLPFQVTPVEGQEFLVDNGHTGGREDFGMPIVLLEQVDLQKRNHTSYNEMVTKVR